MFYLLILCDLFHQIVPGLYGLFGHYIVTIFALVPILQVFDKSGCGYICASDIRAILQCLGEDLTEEESKSLI